MRTARLWRPLLVVLLGEGSVFAEEEPRPPAAATVEEPRNEDDDYLALYGLFAEAVARVEANHARPVDRRALIESALRGMLSELDPYSKYLSPNEIARYRQRVNGRQPNGAHRATVLGATRDDQGEWTYVVRESPRIAVVAVTGFTRATAADLRSVLESLQGESVDGVVLDLRFNAGGLLSASVDVADLLLDEGLIVATEGRNVARRTWNASPGSGFGELPLAVLINRYSASGAEVVAAALQDHDRAVVVGERSWGKGSVQNLFELEDGRSGIKLTTALYQRPSGANIHRLPTMTPDDVWGVSPDDGAALSVSAEETKKLDNHLQRLLAEEVDTDPAPLVDRQRDLAIKLLVQTLGE